MVNVSINILPAHEGRKILAQNGTIVQMSSNVSRIYRLVTNNGTRFELGQNGYGVKLNVSADFTVVLPSGFSYERVINIQESSTNTSSVRVLIPTGECIIYETSALIFVRPNCPNVVHSSLTFSPIVFFNLTKTRYNKTFQADDQNWSVRQFPSGGSPGILHLKEDDFAFFAVSTNMRQMDILDYYFVCLVDTPILVIRQESSFSSENPFNATVTHSLAPMESNTSYTSSQTSSTTISSSTSSSDVSTTSSSSSASSDMSTTSSSSPVSSDETSTVLSSSSLSSVTLTGPDNSSPRNAVVASQLFSVSSVWSWDKFSRF
ncbi:hypothetical protein PROFUN_05999 [Planoprotostelium fungivorum]|uniref:Uncharacterized protein n=1 Tax=Planoprotostelium fungivorum TaxID=1890364 RepID=A0A2P6NPB2_9EUKA|nr:hypothetical protein PROFUN_05999 [Planoprotostelium fungivorum]